MTNQNHLCYQVDTINFRQGLLDRIIDAVYVLLLEGSDRTNQVYRQVNDYQLSKNNHILINQSLYAIQNLDMHH